MVLSGGIGDITGNFAGEIIVCVGRQWMRRELLKQDCQTDVRCFHAAILHKLEPRVGIHRPYGAAILVRVICATECQVNRPDRT